MSQLRREGWEAPRLLKPEPHQIVPFCEITSESDSLFISMSAAWRGEGHDEADVLCLHGDLAEVGDGVAAALSWIFRTLLQLTRRCFGHL